MNSQIFRFIKIVIEIIKINIRIQLLFKEAIQTIIRYFLYGGELAHLLMDLNYFYN